MNHRRAKEPANVHPDLIRVQLERILSSNAFGEAERAKRMLAFIVESALNGRAAEIKEAVIGVEVLGRSSGSTPRSILSFALKRAGSGRAWTRIIKTKGTPIRWRLRSPRARTCRCSRKDKPAREVVAKSPAWRLLLAAFTAGAVVAGITAFLITALGRWPSDQAIAAPRSRRDPICGDIARRQKGRIPFGSTGTANALGALARLPRGAADTRVRVVRFPILVADSKSLAFFGIDKLNVSNSPVDHLRSCAKALSLAAELREAPLHCLCSPSKRRAVQGPCFGRKAGAGHLPRRI